LGGDSDVSTRLVKVFERRWSDPPIFVSEIAESEEELLFLGIISVLLKYNDYGSVVTVFRELAKWGL